jgi:hypothetical protein
MSKNTRIPNRPEDEIDRLFAAYFRAEMPARWPNAPRPWAETVQPAPPASADPTRKSRWALAASVALLIGSCWYLSGHVTDGKAKPGFNPGGGTANLKHLKDMGKDKAKLP